MAGSIWSWRYVKYHRLFERVLQEALKPLLPPRGPIEWRNEELGSKVMVVVKMGNSDAVQAFFGPDCSRIFPDAR